MNKTFNINRFAKLLAYDIGRFKLWIYFPTSILCVIALSLLFRSSSDIDQRMLILNNIILISIISLPEYMYGMCNLTNDGITFAMLPASKFEKFISMLFFCLFFNPLLVISGSLIGDSLLVLVHFKGYDEFIFNSYATEHFNYRSMMLIAALIMLFVTTNTFFKKNKTFFAMLISIVIAFLVIGLGKITNFKETVQPYLSYLYWIIPTLYTAITIGFIWWTWIRIKNMKY